MNPLAHAAETWPEATAVLGKNVYWNFRVLFEKVSGIELPEGDVVIEEGDPLDALLVLLRCMQRNRPVALLNMRHPPETRAWQRSRLAGAVFPEGFHTLLFTSGSTSEPKIVVHALDAHVASAAGSNQNIVLGPGDSWRLSLPLYHVAGIGVVFRCLLAGACIQLPGAEGTPTHESMVPTQLQDAMDEGRDWPGTKAVLLGGAVIPSTLVERAVEVGVPLHTTWGMTETASQVTTTPPGAEPSLLNSAGRVLPHREIRIVDGEIQVRGRTMFRGYLGGKFRSADEWFASGDLGRIDDKGLLHVLGRKDNQFVSGGENIHPETIERALLALPGIARVIVVPVPHERFGFRPVAFVQAGEWKPKHWEAALRESLAGYLVPDRFLPWPKEAFGLKPSRSRLAEAAEKMS